MSQKLKELARSLRENGNIEEAKTIESVLKTSVIFTKKKGGNENGRDSNEDDSEGDSDGEGAAGDISPSQMRIYSTLLKDRIAEREGKQSSGDSNGELGSIED